MKGKTCWIVFVLFGALLVPTVVVADPPLSWEWTMDGDMVFIDNDMVYLSADPATLGSSGWVEFEFESKTFGGDLDSLWGFDSTSAVPKSPQIWRNYTHNMSGYHNVEQYLDIVINNALSYEVLDIVDYDNYRYVIGNKNNTKLWNVTYNYYESLEDDWFEVNIIIAFNSKTIIDPTTIQFFYYDDILTQYFYDSTFFDWKTFDKTITVESYDWDGFDKWYSVNATVQEDKLYRVRCWIDIPFGGLNGSSGKYVWAIKEHNKTMQEAVDSGRLLYLDPWWDSSWGFYKTLSISDNSPSYQMKLIVEYDDDIDGSANVSCEGNCENDFSDLRFVIDNTTECPYWFENKTDGKSIILWVNTTSNDPDSLEMFYGNDDVSSSSDGDTTFIWFDDFEETVGQDAAKWTVYSGITEVGEISDDQAFQGTRSSKQGHEAQSTIYGITGGYSNPGNVRFLFWHYTTDDSSRDTTYYGADEQEVDDDMDAGPRTTFYTGNDIQVYEGGWVDSGRDYYNTIWERVEMRNDDANDEFYLLTNEGVSLNNQHDYQNTMTDINNFVSTTSAAYPTSYLDCMCIMKFILGDEPHWDSFGSEESAPPFVNTEPVLVSVYPVNNSVNVCPTSMELGVTVVDVDGDTLNITFRSNLSGVWDYFYLGDLGVTLVDVVNGTFYIDPVFFNEYDRVYFWNVSVSDGSDINDSGVLVFTTASSPCGGGGGGGSMGGATFGIVGVCGLFGILGFIMNRRRRKEV